MVNAVDLTARGDLPTLSFEMLGQLQDSGLELSPFSLRTAPETILQLGWGKFMRGFIPDFVQLANLDGRYNGRILAVQRKADDRSEAATRQDTLYTLILRGIQRNQQMELKRIIGSVSRLLVADQDWDKVKVAAGKREMRVILSNATETGLTLDPMDHMESQPPRSFPGKLTQLLLERWRTTGGEDADVAVIPTELIENNGQIVHNLVIEQAQAWKLEKEFVDWLRDSVHVASTLVDRIVVGTPRPELLASECETLGYRDDLLTCCEPYYLFAIQADEFTRQHFPMHLASPNVRYVDDLVSYRRRKLRLLNGPQMVLATLGSLLGLRLVYQAVEDPQVGPFNLETLWNEIIPAMGPEEATTNSDYARECLQRIANRTIEHRLQGIRVDLTTKNAIRLFPSIRDFMALRGEMPGRLLLTLAATLAVVLEGGLQDAHADYILKRWSARDSASRESSLAFTRDVLARLSVSTQEALDLERITPEVTDLLLQIQKEDLRAVLARHWPTKAVSQLL